MQSMCYCRTPYVGARNQFFKNINLFIYAYLFVRELRKWRGFFFGYVSRVPKSHSARIFFLFIFFDCEVRVRT